MAKYVCKICGYVHEGDTAPTECPQCKQKDCFEVEQTTEQAAAPKKKGLDTNSNTYTIVYAAVLVAIVAFLLAFVSSTLKPMQDANELRDRKKQMLLSLNIEGLSGSAIDAKYAEVVSSDTLHCNGKDYFQATVEGKTKYIFPVKGAGLWGELWGYIAVNNDMNTVCGVYFGHKSETAGLGARIAERWFQKQFNDKPLKDNDGKIALTVVKEGKSEANWEIDGITGATKTGDGVAEMILKGLSDYEKVLCGEATSAQSETNNE